MSITITDFFAKKLGAPLKNSVWSWGAETNDAVYLRCWQHERVPLEGKTWGVHVDGYSGYVGVTDNLGLNERREHIESIKAGKPAFVVMCIGDPKAEPGADTIKKYNDRELFIGGAVRTLEGGKIVLKITGRKPVAVAAGPARR
jgi:hypothetical protein